MSKDQKTEVSRILLFIQSVLGPHWAEYQGFKELEARTENTSQCMEGQGNNKDRGDFNSCNNMFGKNV